MQERIKKIIQAKGITAAEMADSIGVQRSNISHIINGRNKPGYSFIEKLIQTYPDINTQWLFSGNGEMFLSSKKKIEANLFEPLVSQSEFSNQQIVKSESEVIKPSSNETKEVSAKVIDKKEVERIVIFYNDKTFKEYIPE